MQTFTITAVTLENFCDEYALEEDSVHDVLMDSDMSYGHNDDTLITLGNLCGLLEIDPKEGHDTNLMVSLGC